VNKETGSYRIDDYKSKIDDYKSKIDDYKSKIDDYKSKINVYKSRIDDYKTQVKTYSNHYEDSTYIFTYTGKEYTYKSSDNNSNVNYNRKVSKQTHNIKIR
jgi:uncharacterized coiled-coil DUF342 family protein